MPLDTLATLPWIDVLLKSSLATVVIVPLGIVVYRGGDYLWKRWIEGKRDSEEIERLHRVADLKKKLHEDHTTLDELQSFVSVRPCHLSFSAAS